MVITKVASPALDVQTPLIERSAGGGRTIIGDVQVVISTIVVREASSGDVKVYEVDEPVTLIVVLWLASKSIVPEAAWLPFASTMTYE